MTVTKRVGVKELKNRLSAYLREVRRGRRILVTDRGRVVAELHRAVPVSDPREAAMTEWLESGAVRAPVREKETLPESPVRLPAGTGQGILDELRGG
jgi:prevent-host-death family protein